MKSNPTILREIASVIGWAATDKLTQARGGTRVYIPAKARTDHWLVLAIGMEAAHKLCSHLSVGGVRVGGGRGALVEIPMGVRRRESIVFRAFRELNQRGLTSMSIALELGVSQRSVHAMRAKLRQKTNETTGHTPDKRQGRTIARVTV